MAGADNHLSFGFSQNDLLIKQTKRNAVAKVAGKNFDRIMPESRLTLNDSQLLIDPSSYPMSPKEGLPQEQLIGHY